MSDQIPASADPDVKAAFRALWDAIHRLDGTKNIDLKGRRIINAGASSADGDYVTRAEVVSALSTGRLE